MKADDKKCIFILGISIILPLLFIVLFLHDNEKIEKISLDQFKEITSVTEYGIERVELSDESIFLEGWLIETPGNILRVDRNFILTNGNDSYKLNTTMQERTDITDRWHNGSDYDNSGLTGNGLVKYLDKGSYRIGFLINDNSPYHIGFWNDDDGFQRYYLTDEYLEVK